MKGTVYVLEDIYGEETGAVIKLAKGKSAEKALRKEWTFHETLRGISGVALATKLVQKENAAWLLMPRLWCNLHEGMKFSGGRLSPCSVLMIGERVVRGYRLEWMEG